MFSHLAKKIVAYILLLAFSCIVLISIMSYSLLKENIYNNFVTLSVQYTSQQNKKFDQYKKLIEETSRLISENVNIKNALKAEKFDDTIIPMLDGITASNLNIKGLTIYSAKKSGASESNIIYSSSLISDLPSLDQLYEDTSFRDFVASSDIIMWQLRYKSIMNFYGQQHCFFTNFIKISDEQNNLLGFLVVDTKLNSLFELYKTSTNMFFNNAGTYVFSNDGSIFSAPYSQTLTTITQKDILNDISLKKRYSYSSDKKYIIICSKISEADSIITLVPLNNIQMRFRLLKIILVVLNLCFVIIFIFISKFLSVSVTKPLDKLYQKMEDKFN